MTKGEHVILTIGEHVQIDAIIVLASANGNSLMVAFDALLDGCVGMMPLLLDEKTGWYHNVMTGHVIGVQVPRRI